MKEGDHVIPIFNGECGDCKSCRHGKTNICSSFGVNPMKTVMNNDGRTRFSVITEEGDKKPIYHFLNTSTFSEYTVLESACVVKIDSEAPLKQMTLLSCGASTGTSASKKFCLLMCMFARAYIKGILRRHLIAILVLYTHSHLSL